MHPIVEKVIVAALALATLVVVSTAVAAVVPPAKQPLRISCLR